MSLARYLLIMSIATLVSWVAWVIVLFFIDPFTSGGIGLFCFYVSLFFGCFGFLTLFGFGIRSLIFRKHPAFTHISVSMRQALWLSTMVIVALLLLANHVFSLWAAIFLVLGLTILESVFLFRSSASPHRRSLSEAHELNP